MPDPRAFVTIDAFEHRGDRADYAEQDPACLFHPNGSQITSFDRAFLGAAMREVLAIYAAEG